MTKIIWKIFLSVCLCLIPFNLSAQISSKDDLEQNKLEPIIIFERTECYGVCPKYSVKIFTDRSLIYEGINFVKIKGKVNSEISKDQFQQLITEIKKANYFSLRNSYSDEKDGCKALSSDSPWVYTTIQIAARKKSVAHYLGCVGGNNKFDKELKILTKLEDKIDEIIGIDQWIGNKKERSKFSYLRKL